MSCVRGRRGNGAPYERAAGGVGVKAESRERARVHEDRPRSRTKFSSIFFQNLLMGSPRSRSLSERVGISFKLFLRLNALSKPAMRTPKYTANIADRDPIDIHNNPQILHLAASAQGNAVMATFPALGKIFQAVLVQRVKLPTSKNDLNDDDAMQRGYTELNTVIARDAKGLSYAVWEFYSTDEGEPHLSKAMDVDPRHQRKRLGMAFWTALQQSGFNIAPSDSLTTAGAAFLNKLG